MPVPGFNGSKATNLNVGAVVVAFANTVIQTVVAFGLSLTAYQQASIMATVNAGVLLVIALFHVASAKQRDKQAAP